MYCQLNISNQTVDAIPSYLTLSSWVNTVLHETIMPVDIRQFSRVIIELSAINLTEMQELNYQYRGLLKPTNILSFNIDSRISNNSYLLGSLAVCTRVMHIQATKANKSLLAHWAHIIVHGCLHLLGFDHQIDQEELIMIAQEKLILSKLGYNYLLPYAN